MPKLKASKRGFGHLLDNDIDILYEGTITSVEKENKKRKVEGETLLREEVDDDEKAFTMKDNEKRFECSRYQYLETFMKKTVEKEIEALVIKCKRIVHRTNFLELQNAELQQRLDARDREITVVKEENSKLLQEENDLKGKNDILLLQAKGINEKNGLLLKQINGLNETNSKLLKEVNGLNEKKDKLLKEVNDLNEKKDKLLKEVNGLNDKLQEEVSGLKKRNDQLLLQANDFKKKNIELQEKANGLINFLQEEVRVRQQQLSLYEEKMVTVIKIKDRDLRNLQFSKDSLEIKCEEKVKTLENTKSKLSDNVKELKEELRKLLEVQKSYLGLKEQNVDLKREAKDAKKNKQEIVQLHLEVKNTKERNVKLHEELKELKKAKEESSDILRDKDRLLEDCKKEIEKLEENNNVLSNSNKKLSSERIDLQYQLRKTQTESSSIRQQLADKDKLKSKLEGRELKITKLQKELADLRSTNSSRETQLVGRDTKILGGRENDAKRHIRDPRLKKGQEKNDTADESQGFNLNHLNKGDSFFSSGLPNVDINCFDQRSLPLPNQSDRSQSSINFNSVKYYEYSQYFAQNNISSFPGPQIHQSQWHYFNQQQQFFHASNK